MRECRFSRLIALCLVLIMAAACNFTPERSSTVTSPALETPAAAASPQVVENATATVQTQDMTSAPAENETSATVTVPDPLDNLLEMRSIKISLSGVHADGTSRSIDVEIDSTGNMHLQYTRPIPASEGLPEGITLPEIVPSYEVYVIDGKAFAPSESDPTWVDNPVDADFIPVLSGQMHGLDGFTTWLDLLPAGSLQPAGNETVGGFSTDKYSISGLVDGQQISGMLWYDPQTHALVKAEMHIPASLNSDPANPESGEILITLAAEKAEIPPITLPSN